MEYIYIFSNSGHSYPLKSNKDMTNIEALKELEKQSLFSFNYLKNHCKIEKKIINE